MDKYCGNCKYDDILLIEEPCVRCSYNDNVEASSQWTPKEEKEEKECENCKYFYKDLDEYPCTDCKYHSGNNDKWESEGGQDNVNSQTHTKDYIIAICEEIKTFLIEKNEAYGNSVPDPIRIFSKADALEQINVRIDDKLSRIMRGKEYGQEDTELDLIGYLILKRAVKRNMIEEL